MADSPLPGLDTRLRTMSEQQRQASALYRSMKKDYAVGCLGMLLCRKQRPLHEIDRLLLTKELEALQKSIEEAHRGIDIVIAYLDTPKSVQDSKGAAITKELFQKEYNKCAEQARRTEEEIRTYLQTDYARGPLAKRRATRIFDI